jgi:6-pyruvoyltetrahydropterin/6-carboxytetrahydropterin synthase
MKAFDTGLHVKVVRTASFSAAHRYFNPLMSIDQNKQSFGSLYRDEGFGHNFLIEAHFSGPIDPMTGMIINLTDIDRWLKETVTVVDHQDLNRLEAFKTSPPTPETIARFFFQEISRKMENYQQPYSGRSVILQNVRVYEGDDMWVDYRAFTPLKV